MIPNSICFWRWVAPAVGVMLWLLGRAGAAEFEAASWVSQHGRAALVHVTEGTKRVRLQTRAAATAEWSTVGIIHLEGRAGTVKLRLPDGVALENIAVEASLTDPFPYTYYRGRNSFEAASSSGPADGRNGGLLAPGAVADAEAGDPGSPAAVQESDIWKWRDRTLYYFNAMRGLQVFDLSDFERPRRLAGLRLPAVGEDMYLLGGDHVVLLANRPDDGWGSDPSGGPRSEVVVVRHAGSALTEVARVPIQGAFMESRMVGSTLCVVSQKVVAELAPEGGLMFMPRQYVYAVDFSDPARPQTRGPLDVTNSEGAWTWQSVVQATSEFLFVATNSWQTEGGMRTRLNVIDLRVPGQPLAVAAQFNLAGQLQSRFQISYANGIVTTVSESGGAVIETWDLTRAMLGAGPAAPVPLDALLVGRNESLFATRFDGGRVYVVTFRRIDPLFCVDLTDPSDLRLLGELEVPGFSTYLEAFADGTRLLSLGVEDSRVAVSLFDVATPATPTLKGRVYFGDREHWSWSEGNYDDKAIGFFRDAGLMLFPLQQWSADHGYRTGMQLVDATADGLRARGFVDHRFSARRGRLFEKTLVSIGGHELFVLDISDRDQPRKVAALTVAWPVQAVVPYGDRLVQIEDGDQMAYVHAPDSPPRHAHLRLTSKTELDAPVAELGLGRAGQIAGTAMRGNTLYVLLRSIEGRSVPDADGNTGLEWSTQLTTIVVDLAAPEGPRVTGAAPSEREGYSWGYGRLESHWLPDGRLLWFPAEPSGRSLWWGCRGCAIDVVGGAVMDGGFVGMPWRWGGGQPDDLLVVDVADAAAPRVLAREAVVPDSENFSTGRVFLAADDRLLSSWSTWKVTDNVWAEQSFVQEIDLAESAVPRRGPLATVPALVQGVHRTEAGGLLLFVSRQEILVKPDAAPTWTTNLLVDALVYDGVQAFLIDTALIEGGAHLSTVVSGAHFLALQQSADEKSGASLRALAWSGDTGKWSALADIPLNVRWPTLQQQGGYLFASDAYRTETVAVHQLPAAPARTLQLLDVPVWARSAPALDLPDRVAWLPVGEYGVERLDLSALPVPASPTARAQRDRGSVEWHTLAVLPIDIVPIDGREGGIAPLAGADFTFVADGDAETYAAWTTRHFVDGTLAAAGAMADPDRDGFDNYSEWAFGTSPTDDRSQPQITASFVPADGDQTARLLLSARLNPLAEVEASGLTSYLHLAPQLSTDLTNWHTLPADEVETTTTPIRRLWSLPVPADASAAFGRLQVFFMMEG